jgi:hypothetical protein
MQGTQDCPPWVIPSEHTQLDFVRIKHIGLALQCYAWRSRRHSGGVAVRWSRMVPLSHPACSTPAILSNCKHKTCVARQEPLTVS